jgi:hypothetical protein
MLPFKFFYHSFTNLHFYSILNTDEEVIRKKNETHYKILMLSVHRSPVSIRERTCINQCLVRTEVRGPTVLQEQFAVLQMHRK